MTKEEQLVADFCAHHHARPEVWLAYEADVLKKIAAGAKRISSRGVFEDIRPKLPGLLNNNFTKLYGKLFDVAHPEHKGLIERRNQTKRRKSGPAPYFCPPDEDDPALNAKLEALLSATCQMELL